MFTRMSQAAGYLCNASIRGVLLVGVIVVSVSACGLFGKEEDVTRNWSAQRLYSAGKTELEGGNWPTAIEFYEKLETRYPFNPFTMQAQLEIAYAYYKVSEPASSVAAADRFIKLYPQHPNVDYAYYIKGLAQFDRDEASWTGCRSSTLRNVIRGPLWSLSKISRSWCDGSRTVGMPRTLARACCSYVTISPNTKCT